jgi:hypothetical protein
MSVERINSNAINEAIEASKNSLKSDLDIAWIRNSALFERAYFLGLYKGLSSISNDESLDKLLLYCLMNTMWERDADDSFNSTQTGKNFQQLKVEFDRAVSGEELKILSLESVLEVVEVNNKRWSDSVDNVRTVIDEMLRTSFEFNRGISKKVSDPNDRNEFYKKMNPRRLEAMLRLISLIETNHKLQKNQDS